MLPQPPSPTLLARPGLDVAVRLLVGAGVAACCGNWPGLRAWGEAARDRRRPRADLEETLLQGVLFSGFPRIVTAFEHLAAVWPAPAVPTGGGLPAGEQRAAGERLFAAIYGENTAAVAAMLRGFHADFHDFVLEAAYGRILTRPHLDPKTRELLATGLLAATEQPRQFAGHARGARRFGAGDEELREVLATVFDDERVIAQWLQRTR
jgi:alkylhydroperoxidase/carboxymuconolactone decarboxylase family protein YurZ